ncbi:MAG: hypothetical protein AAF387_03635 [Pseudomonadota bacterium]
MGIFLSRSETTTEISIRYKATWLYLLLVGLSLMLVLSVVQFPFDPEPLKQSIFAFYVIAFIVYYVTTLKTRREIFQAIRERRIRVAGSRFNPRNPLVVIISKDPTAPSAAAEQQ